MTVTTTLIDTAQERAARVAKLAARYAAGDTERYCAACRETEGGCAEHVAFAEQLRDAAKSFEEDVAKLEAKAERQGGVVKGRKGRVVGGRMDLARVVELFGLTPAQAKDVEDEQSAVEFRASLDAAERQEAAVCATCARNSERYGIQGCNRHRAA